MNETTLQQILSEIKNSKEELKNLILASETRLQLYIEENNNRISILEAENSELKSKVEKLERKLKQSNIIVYGLNKKPEKITVDTVYKETSKLEIKIEERDVSNCYCIGKLINCPVKIQLVSKFKKQQIFKNGRK